MTRRALIVAACCSLFAGFAGGARPAPSDESYLDRLAGRWVLRGTIAGKQTTHDVDAEWMLGRRYLRLHEVSREQDAAGHPQYEAVILVGRDEKAGEYQCLWLDSTGGGGLTPQSIGIGRREGDRIPFLWRERDGTVSLRNTFAYDRAAGSWSWAIDNIDKGKAAPFARLTLTRR